MNGLTEAKRLVCCMLASLLISVSCGGCAYLGDRARDLSDIISVGVSTGGGVLVGAKATRLLSLDLGTRKNETFHGWHARHGRWIESTEGIWFAFFWSPRLGKEPAPPWAWTDVLKTSHTKKALLGSDHTSAVDSTRYEERAYHLFVLTRRENAPLIEELDIQLDASFIIGGLQLVVSPGQLLDFLAGILTLDLAGDDAPDGEASDGEAPDGEEVAPEDSRGGGEDG